MRGGVNVSSSGTVSECKQAGCSALLTSYLVHWMYSSATAEFHVLVEEWQIALREGYIAL